MGSRVDERRCTRDDVDTNVALRFTFTHIDGEESCTHRVVEEHEKNKWVCFARHGLPNTKQPFDSTFALHNITLQSNESRGAI